MIFPDPFQHRRFPNRDDCGTLGESQPGLYKCDWSENQQTNDQVHCATQKIENRARSDERTIFCDSNRLSEINEQCSKGRYVGENDRTKAREKAMISTLN